MTCGSADFFDHTGTTSTAEDQGEEVSDWYQNELKKNSERRIISFDIDARAQTDDIRHRLPGGNLVHVVNAARPSLLGKGRGEYLPSGRRRGIREGAAEAADFFESNLPPLNRPAGADARGGQGGPPTVAEEQRRAWGRGGGLASA